MANAGWFDECPDLEYPFEQCRNVAQEYNPYLAGIASVVEESIRLRGGNVPIAFVGGFPLGETNACVKPMRDGALILFNHGLIQLIYQIGKVFILSYDWLCAWADDDDDVSVLTDRVPPDKTMTATLGWETCEWTRRQSLSALTAILHSYLRDGSVTTAPRQKLPAGMRALTLETLVRYAETFVVAHEYAHVMLGHCEEPLTDLPNPTGTLSGVVIRNRQQEFEADELATSLLLTSSDWNSPGGEFDVNARVAGIALFFASVLLRAVAVKGPIGVGLDADVSDSHPTPNARMSCLFSFLHRKYGRSSTRLARVCMAWVLTDIKEVYSAIAILSEAIDLETSAQVCYEQQRHADAAEFFRRVIGIRETVLGNSHLAIAAPLSNLGNCISHLGQLEEAENCFIRTLAICETAGSLAEDYLATSLNNLGSHYARIGEHELARRYFQRSLEQAEARLAKDSRAFAICVHNYLHVLGELKRDDDVEALCKHSVTITRRTLGEEHPDCLFNISRLAALYEHTNRYSQAIPLSEEVVDISRRVLGEQHPNFATAINNLAYLYMSSGRFAEAELLYDQALQIDRKARGEENPAFATSLNNLGLLYEATNRCSEAERAFQRAVDIMTIAVGVHDPRTKTFSGNLRRVLQMKE